MINGRKKIVKNKKTEGEEGIRGEHRKGKEREGTAGMIMGTG